MPAANISPPESGLNNQTCQEPVMGIVHKVIKAGATRIATKAIRTVPVLGTAVVFGMAGYEMKKKGVIKGLANVALDATPFVGVAKNVIEVFTGDWFPDKEKKA
jgi:F0F1-type ATP synthase membrane subunit a